MSKQTPLKRAIALIESDMIKQPVTDMDKAHNEALGRSVIRLQALLPFEREFAEENWNEGFKQALRPNGTDFDKQFDTFYKQFEQ